MNIDFRTTREVRIYGDFNFADTRLTIRLSDDNGFKLYRVYADCSSNETWNDLTRFLASLAYDFAFFKADASETDYALRASGYFNFDDARFRYTEGE